MTRTHRRRIPCLIFLALLIARVVVAQTGQVSGRVTDSTNGAGLANVRVDFYQVVGSSGWPLVSSVTTDGNGNYVKPGLPPAEYAVKTTNSALYVDEAYNNVPCLGIVSDCAGLTRLTVTAGGSISNIDFALSAGGGFSGRVTDGAGHGLPNVLVSPYQKSASGTYTPLVGVYTDASGNYAITTGLPAGTYYVKTANSAGYVDEIYNDVACPKSIGSCPPGTGVNVTQGASTPNIDFALAAGGRVAGRVTDGANVGLQGISVYVYEKTVSGSYTYLFSSSTDASGHYLSTTGLPSGVYYLKTYNRAGLMDEVYDDVACPGYRYIGNCPTGTGVSVTLGVTTPNIDFVLLPAGNISGRVINSAGVGLGGVEVDVYEQVSGSFSNVTSARTDTSGTYTIATGLPAGTYYLRTLNSAGYVDEVYDNQPCLGGNCPWSSGTGVTVTAGVTTPNIDFVLEVPRATLPAGDYDGDGKADVAVYRPATGVWYIIRSGTGTAIGIPWGVAGDVPVPADYDGDKKTDAAVFRPSNGTWYVLQTSTGTGVGLSWGVASDVPVPADYDGDGKADVAVFRPSTGTWFIIRSSLGTAVAFSWGTAGDVPAPADYDGDRKADPTVFRPATGTWYELRSTTGTGFGLGWGQAGDTPVPGDFDGDGKIDPAVFRASTWTWYQFRSATQSGFGMQWGASGDQPIAGDYDGDKKADPTVFRAAAGTWYELRSGTGAGFGVFWGQGGDIAR